MFIESVVVLKLQCGGRTPEIEEIVGHTEGHIVEMRYIQQCVDDRLKLRARLEGDDKA